VKLVRFEGDNTNLRDSDMSSADKECINLAEG